MHSLQFPVYNIFIQSYFILKGDYIMRLEQFEAILETANQHSMQKAAESLYTSTQNISKLIKDFEKEIHTQVFTRNPHGVFLTPDGEYIVAELQKAMNIITNLKATYLDDTLNDDSNASKEIDRIHILSVPSESEITSALLEQLNKKYILQNALINIKDAMIINKLLEKGCAELFFDYDLIFLNLLDSQLNMIQSLCLNVPVFSLYKNRLGVHINNSCELSEKANISVKELYKIPLVAYVPDNQETTLPLLALKNIGCNFSPQYIVKSERICQNFIQNGMGFSFVPFLNQPKSSKDITPEDRTTILPLKEKVYISHILIVNPELAAQSYYSRIINFLKKHYKYMNKI